jgi:hypothetical protein
MTRYTSQEVHLSHSQVQEREVGAGENIKGPAKHADEQDSGRQHTQRGCPGNGQKVAGAIDRSTRMAPSRLPTPTQIIHAQRMIPMESSLPWKTISDSRRNTIWPSWQTMPSESTAGR